MKDIIKKEGILPIGRAVWAIIENDNIGSMGILGIYTPNDILDKTALQKEIFAHLDFSVQWIMLGDFNMIENSSDQRGGNCTIIHVDEKRAWLHLTKRLKIEDSFIYQLGNPHFSWDNKRRF